MVLEWVGRVLEGHGRHGVRGCDGGEGPLRATGREGVVLEWVGRVLEGYGRYGMGWRGPGRSQRHGMERLLQPHQQQRLQPVHRARLRTLQLGGGRGQRSGVRGQSTRSEVKIGGGPFKGAGRRRMALEGSWKDMEGMGSRDAMGGAGPLRATGRGKWCWNGLEGSWKDMEGMGSGDAMGVRAL